MINLFLPNSTPSTSTLTISLTEDKMHCKIGENKFVVDLKEYLTKSDDVNHSHATFDTQKSNIENQKPNLRNSCFNMTRKLGFNNRSKGTFFVVEAILYLYENDIDFVEMKNVYNVLAEKFSLKPKDIREPLRKSVERMAEKFDYSRFNNYLNISHEKYPITPRFVIIHGLYDLRKKYPPAQYSKERIKKVLYSLY